MKWLLIAFTLILGLVGDANARAVGGQNDKMDGESLPSNELLLERKAKETQFFEIYIEIDVPLFTLDLCYGTHCTPAVQSSLNDEITQILIDYQFGDGGDGTDPASEICNNEPPPRETGSVTKRETYYTVDGIFHIYYPQPILQEYFSRPDGSYISPIIYPGDTPGVRTTAKYQWFRSGPCSHCGSTNADARMLFTTVEAFSATLKHAVVRNKSW